MVTQRRWDKLMTKRRWDKLVEKRGCDKLMVKSWWENVEKRRKDVII